MTEHVDPNAQPPGTAPGGKNQTEVVVVPDAAAQRAVERAAAPRVPAARPGGEPADVDGAPHPAFSRETLLGPHHPNLGLPPIDMTAGFPEAAERVRHGQTRFAARSLEAAIALAPSLAERYDELGLRRLLHDAEVLIERLTRSLASGDPRWAREMAEWSAPVYRRRGVPLADVVMLSEGIRDAIGATLGPEERVALDEAIDAAIAVFEWNARLAGDAKKRNPILNFLYRGA